MTHEPVTAELIDRAASATLNTVVTTRTT